MIFDSELTITYFIKIILNGAVLIIMLSLCVHPLATIDEIVVLPKYIFRLCNNCFDRLK